MRAQQTNVIVPARASSRWWPDEQQGHPVPPSCPVCRQRVWSRLSARAGRNSTVSTVSLSPLASRVHLRAGSVQLGGGVSRGGDPAVRRPGLFLRQAGDGRPERRGQVVRCAPVPDGRNLMLPGQAYRPSPSQAVFRRSTKGHGGVRTRPAYVRVLQGMTAVHSS